jgi:hypothetical protein
MPEIRLDRTRVVTIVGELVAAGMAEHVGVQAKSWELRAAMSMARLWRDQGKPQQARELLASVYG